MPAKLNISKGWTLVISAFMIVFAFGTVDHAISPMVEVLQGVFAVPEQRVLWLISYCTIGIVFGLFAGPQLLKTFKIKNVLFWAIFMQIAGLGVFVTVKIFYISLAARFLFGLGSGIISTILWWLAYEAVDRNFYTPMITVLTASRPMAVAAGVPLVMYGTKHLGWAAAFALTGVILFLFCFSFAWALPDDNKTKTGFTLKNIALTYSAAFKTPLLKNFFAAMFINRLCYFGFYSMLGIWFAHKYGLTTVQMAKPLMVIGLCETVINFIVPKLMKIGQKKLFYAALVINTAVFAAFIWGFMPVWHSIFFIGIFAMTDRIYNMLLLMFIPKIFPNAQDKTTIGSLVTLVSWTSLAVVSYAQGAFLGALGINVFAALLIAALILGFLVYLPVLKQTVFKPQSNNI